MISGSFDKENTLLTGTIETEIREPGGTPTDKVARMNQPCNVHFNWTVSGPVVPYLGGQFELLVGFESLGPGPEFTIGPVYVATTASAIAGGKLSYSLDVPIPAGRVPSEGTYRVSKRLLYHGPFGGTQQAAVVESEDIEFY